VFAWDINENILKNFFAPNFIIDKGKNSWYQNTLSTVNSFLV